MNIRFLLGFIFAVYTAAASDTHRIRVAVYQDNGAAGRGVPCVCTELGKCEEQFSVTKVSAKQIREGVLDNFDVVVFTGGAASTQAKTLGEQGRANVKKFVEKGGGYMGICAGAYLACDGFDWAVGVIGAKTVSPKWQRGEGIVEIELTPEGQKLLGQTNKTFSVKYENGPIIKHNSATLPEFKTLAVFRTEKAENGSPKGIMVNSPAIAVSTCGKGRVILISPHPEQSPGAESIISAAIKWVANKELRLTTPRAS